MYIRWLATLLLSVLWTSSGFAQSVWNFQWEKGQTLTYKVQHLTNVAEVVDKNKSESNSTLHLVKRWQVTDVDSKGIATLSMSLIAMRNEQKRTNGETLFYDSQNEDKSTPGLRDQMRKYIGTTLAVLRVDRFGRVIETKLGSAVRYEAEPPFGIVLPAGKIEAGQTWRRPYTIVMEPPHGTGEKYQAEHLYVCKKIDAARGTVALSTQFKTKPDNLFDRLPLLQKDARGEVVFDLQKGRVAAIHLSIDETIENHQGKGSSYHFQSQYRETLVE
jgi:hypothetical protein